jgi:hypothetical protein
LPAPWTTCAPGHEAPAPVPIRARLPGPPPPGRRPGRRRPGGRAVTRNRPRSSGSARPTRPGDYRVLRSGPLPAPRRRVRGLPQVFDTTRRPWIRPELPDAQAVAEVIPRCPMRCRPAPPRRHPGPAAGSRREALNRSAAPGTSARLTWAAGQVADGWARWRDRRGGADPTTVPEQRRRRRPRRRRPARS